MTLSALVLSTVSGPMFAQAPVVKAASVQLAATPPGSGTAWAALTIPQGVAPSALQGQGKLVLYRDGTTLHVFSAVTRCWHDTTVSATATTRLFNDCLIILENGYCRALGSYSGAFVDVPVAAGAAVLNGGSHKNDSIVLVADGNQVHAFSGFTGTWTTQAVGSNYGTAVQRHVALISDGNRALAMDAFGGQWHEQQAPAAVNWLSADGTVGLCSSGGWVFGFSANTGTWHAHQVPAGASFLRGDDWGLWYGAGRVIAFSGVRSVFTGLVADVSGTWGTTDLYALLATPLGLTAYSAVTATFSPPQRDPLQVELGGAAALLLNSNFVRGYSPLRQRFALLNETPGSSGVTNTVGYVAAASTNHPHLWSSLTAGWHTAPAGAQNSSPVMTATTIGVTTATETYAFSANHGTFIPLGGNVIGVIANPTSAPLVAFDSNSLFAFDTRTDRWLATPRTSSNPPVFRVWRTTALILDGSFAHGFGAQAGVFHRYDLPSVTSSVYANSEVGYAATNNLIAACSMMPTVATFAQFPHFRRVQSLLAPLRQTVTIPSGALAVVLVGQLSQPLPIANLGTLWLAPANTMLVSAGTSTSPPPVQLSWAMPPNPLLLGATIGSQAVVLPATVAPYLTELSTVQIW